MENVLFLNVFLILSSVLTMIQFMMGDYDEETKEKYLAKFLDFVHALWKKNYNKSKNNKTSSNANLKSNNLDADVRKWLGDQLFSLQFTHTLASAGFIKFYWGGNDRSITIEMGTKDYIGSILKRRV